MTTPTFDYATWAAMFPELAYITQPTATIYFQIAQEGIDVGPCGWASQLNFLVGQPGATLVNLLVAHVAQILAPAPNGSASSQLVGRISAATQGSVSVTSELKTSGNAAWYAQTKYGLMFWQLAAQYRTFRYNPSPSVVRRRYGYGYGRGYGW